MAVPLAGTGSDRARTGPAWQRARPRLRGALVHPLVPILLLAAALRLWGLADQPALYFDSGVYLGEGQFLASAAERAISALVQPAPDASGDPLERVVRAVERGTLAHPPDIGKPGHAILLAVSMLLLGKTVFAGALVSALAGVGAVATTYALGALGWGRRVAIPAALFLAVSGQHLVYSREPLVESDGLFFAALGALVYLRGVARPERSLRPLVLAGLLFGLAFTSNSRFSYWPAVLLPLELALWRDAGWRRYRRLAERGAALVLGFVAPLAAIEALYVLARLVGRAYGASTAWLDYAQQLAAFWRMNAPDRIRWDEWPTYYVDVALMDGILVLALAVAGVALALGRRSRSDLLLLGGLLVPVALYSVYSTGEVRLRHFSLALPWLMLAAGLGTDAAARLLARAVRVRAGALTAVVTTGVVLLALPRVAALLAAPNALPGLLEYLDRQGIDRVASTNGPVLGFLIGEERTNARLRPAFVNTPADLEAIAREYPYLVVDMQASLFPGELTARYDAAQPVLALPHGNGAWYLADLLDHYGVAWGQWDWLLRLRDTQRASATQLRLFDTRSFLPPP